MNPSRNTRGTHRSSFLEKELLDQKKVKKELIRMLRNRSNKSSKNILTKRSGNRLQDKKKITNDEEIKKELKKIY